MDIISEKTHWLLYAFNGQLYVCKDKQYYTMAQAYHFNLENLKIVPISDSWFHLGEYQPLYLFVDKLSELPIMFSNTRFIVNTQTNIVYIKPSTYAMAVKADKTTPCSFDFYGDFKFGGMYSPFLNVASHFVGKTFLEAINYQSPVKKAIMMTSAPPAAPAAPLAAAPAPKQQEESMMTFIIPFFNSTNVSALKKTIASIKAAVAYCIILVVVPPPQMPFIKDIQSPLVRVVEYKGYVGQLGFENRLNINMKNRCDRASFYNNLISTFGTKTKMCAVWQHNWVVEKWHGKRGTFAVYNYYYLLGSKEEEEEEEEEEKEEEVEEEEEEEKEKEEVEEEKEEVEEKIVRSPNNAGMMGVILHAGTDKYETTPDLFDVTVRSVNQNQEIVVKAIFDAQDYADNRLLHVYSRHMVDMKMFFSTLLKKV